jgi:hypothetical protein
MEKPGHIHDIRDPTGAGKGKNSKCSAYEMRLQANAKELADGEHLKKSEKQATRGSVTSCGNF